MSGVMAETWQIFPKILLSSDEILYGVELSEILSTCGTFVSANLLVKNAEIIENIFILSYVK